MKMTRLGQNDLTEFGFSKFDQVHFPRKVGPGSVGSAPRERNRRSFSNYIPEITGEDL